MYILCLNFCFEHFSKTPSTLKVHYGAVISQQESSIKQTCSWFKVALRTLFCCSLKRLKPVKTSATADGRPVIDRRLLLFLHGGLSKPASLMQQGDPSASINNSHICGGSWRKSVWRAPDRPCILQERNVGFPANCPAFDPAVAATLLTASAGRGAATKWVSGSYCLHGGH